jgi:asparagine synthase (glutamine-hydrolysing)
MDSSLLLALMSQEGDSRPTYTVGYGAGFPDDELAEAARTAAHFGARHVSVELTPETFERYLPAVVRSLEEPVAAASIVPMFAVCERASQDVKVALIGQGPDELFGGYKRHLGVYYGAYWRHLPTSLRRTAGRWLARLPRNSAIKRGLFALDVPDQFRRFQSVFSILPGNSVDALFRDGVVDPGAGDRILDCWSELRSQVDGTDELGAFQLLEIRSSLPDELLVYGDKLSMAHGLEVRVPYLDREVVEYAQCLPANLKISFGRRKLLHREVCAALLPSDVTGRKKKGFAGNVVDDWFRQSVSRRLEDLLLDKGSRMYAFLEPRAVGALFRAHQSGAEDHHKILFSLVVFEMWLRTSIE